ncbi:molybdopterin-dependent oxidoreductase [Acuticoccus mangrovi]|uniref:Molybdopterin-dependent oxidoreductase n=1 Tax=Acuticoccus mangrovi TaxID=2796142 RepID=A0A934MJJ6_9HYPH|nr:molybdopterin-dependent oxidoreductase [Acuticoccus mangrovi]MBJ3778376.1 molybdopterin-dependent oxidoreductase [Acuticoccus mangrovi]
MALRFAAGLLGAAAAALALCLVVTPAAAESAATAGGDAADEAGAVILEVTGGVTGGSQAFTLRRLRSLPVTSVETSTIWTSGIIRFEGVALADLLAAVEARGSRLRAVALNDYAVEIPIDAAGLDGALIAYLADGRPMPVREMGPLWIVFPYDLSARYRSELIYSRSIWQLRRLTVED